MEVDEGIRLADSPVPNALPHLSEAESKAKGKAARGRAPRESHSVFEATRDRPDPIALLEEQAGARIASVIREQAETSPDDGKRLEDMVAPVRR